MPGLQVALSFLNQVLGDPEYLRRDRVNLLNLFRPDQTVNDMVNMTERLLGGALEGGSVTGADPAKIASLLKGEPPTIIEAQRAPSPAPSAGGEDDFSDVAAAVGASEETAFDDLPRTRNLKIMRRVLRAVFEDRDPGDLSALANPEAVDRLREKLAAG